VSITKKRKKEKSKKELKNMSIPGSREEGIIMKDDWGPFHVALLISRFFFIAQFGGQEHDKVRQVTQNPSESLYLCSRGPIQMKG
jgi:tRNA splicing endonuclease